MFIARSASAATLGVCSSGCAYSSLQAAIDAASPGDTILLRAGETFVGPFVLRAKPTSTAWITIRSDAADALLPPSGVRLVPGGKPGANTPTALLARLVGQGGALKTTPVLRTAPGAHHYALRFLEIDGSANLGFETLVALGDDTTATPAHDLVIDRVYAHGHPYKGQKRGISLNSERTDILNSYISDIKAVNADSQAIAGYNGAGPFRIVNNYLEGAGENVMFGGSDPAVTNLIPSNIEVRSNHLFKPLAWQNAILAAPGSPHATASSTAGNLAATMHYFRIVAVMDTDTVVALSTPSSEVSFAQSAAGRSIALSWSAVPGADRYRIYRGTSAGGESVYLETAGAVTSFTYTGTSERSGTTSAAGTKWTVKNIFELKNAQYVHVEGNVFENVWQAGQYGYALVLTPRNQDGGAPWVYVRDVLITNNIVRHASGVLQLSGYDATNPSRQTQRITLRNNLFDDIDPQKWGGNAKVFLIGEGPSGIVIDRSTIVHTNSSVVYAYGTATIAGFVYTNNISQHFAYGIMGEGGRPGQYTIDKYFPNSTITNNVLAGGSASSYPAPNAFPTVAQWFASFADFAGGDYRLLASSVFYAAGTGGSVPGANLGAIDAAIGGSTPPSEPPPPPPPPPSNVTPTARPGGPYSGSVGSAITGDGNSSSDPDGSIVDYRWTWGDEIVVNAADVAAANIVGSRWSRVQSSGASGGVAIANPNLNQGKVASAATAPGSYVDVRFSAAAGVPYRLWFRMRAEADSYLNDSMYVQFSGAVDPQGQAVNRIGTTGAATVVLEDHNAAGVSGWGWNDAAYGAMAAPVYFATSGIQTLRIQQREDGIRWDQIVLSSGLYFNTAPGLARVDTNIVDVPVSTGVVASHVYTRAGQFPIALAVKDDDGAWGTAGTTAAIGVSTGAIVARAGGPYDGSAGATIAFDAGGSSIPAGVSAQYRWSFGDDVVLDSTRLHASGTRWRATADSSAATGAALENPDAATPKSGTALASPASYVEATFRAAAGVPYRIWVRMRAAGDSYSNDSIFVQFSGSVSSTGAPVTRIGSTGALVVVLEEGNGAGVHGWGWNDPSYGSIAAPIYFNDDGTQTIRIQQREDGIRLDQVVISSGKFFAAAPGAATMDSTIVPVFAADAIGPAVGHVYRTAGVFPVVLTIDGGTAGVATDVTTARVR